MLRSASKLRARFCRSTQSQLQYKKYRLAWSTKQCQLAVYACANCSQEAASDKQAYHRCRCQKALRSASGSGPNFGFVFPQWCPSETQFWAHNGTLVIWRIRNTKIGQKRPKFPPNAPLWRPWALWSGHGLIHFVVDNWQTRRCRGHMPWCCGPPTTCFRPSLGSFGLHLGHYSGLHYRD